eukprot:2504064-Prymnesium_polylepis.1
MQEQRLGRGRPRKSDVTLPILSGNAVEKLALVSCACLTGTWERRRYVPRETVKPSRPSSSVNHDGGGRSIKNGGRTTAKLEGDEGPAC